MPLFLVLNQSAAAVEVRWDLVVQHGVDSLKENGRMGVNSQTEGWNVEMTESLWEIRHLKWSLAIVVQILPGNKKTQHPTCLHLRNTFKLEIKTHLKHNSGNVRNIQQA
jgi:hypothetical protein